MLRLVPLGVRAGDDVENPGARPHERGARGVRRLSPCRRTRGGSWRCFVLRIPFGWGFLSHGHVKAKRGSGF